MLTKEQQIQMIKEISDVAGPSGFEDGVVELVKKWTDGLGTYEEDHMRNLYIYRKENTGNKPVVMLDAHSDEVGFMVHSIRPNGTIRFVNIGSWPMSVLASSDVLVRNSEGAYVPGIIAAKPVHFQTPAEMSGKPDSISAFSIDVGASNALETKNDYKIRIGEPIVPATKCHYEEEHELFFGKAFDCRIGVCAMIETLHRLEGMDLPVDVVAVLSSQEEVGARGAKVSVAHVKPDIAFVYEGCPADDTVMEPYAVQAAIKKGPMFRFMDRTVICSPRYQRFILDLAEEKNIPVQASVREGGGNDASVIHTALENGIPSVVCGIPVRYIHSMNCICSYTDFLHAADIASETLKALDEKTIAGF